MVSWYRGSMSGAVLSVTVAESAHQCHTPYPVETPILRVTKTGSKLWLTLLFQASHLPSVLSPGGDSPAYRHLSLSMTEM